MADKQMNYTPEQTAEIVQLYVQGTEVERIAEIYSKTARSIIAKLSREGVYKPKSKTGAQKRVTKAEMLRQIEQKLGLDAESLQSMEKGSMEAVELLFKAV